MPISIPSLEGKNLQISSVVLGSRLVKPENNSSDVRHRGLGERFRALGVTRDPLMVDDKKLVPSIGHVFLSLQTLYVFPRFMAARLQIVRRASRVGPGCSFSVTDEGARIGTASGAAVGHR